MKSNMKNNQKIGKLKTIMKTTRKTEIKTTKTTTHEPTYKPNTGNQHTKPSNIDNQQHPERSVNPTSGLKINNHKVIPP